ncbi:MAG: DoxX family protein [Verrucomicrobia bacterium]|nr:DoxX family protein [Verrucomicrobiota bacterium]MCH8511289.1 DoxX family protein [Kiritimatiellia bacterium]
MNTKILRGLIWTARVFVAGVFLYAAWGKILDPRGFGRDIHNYQMVSDGWVTLTALFLPWLELWCAVALLAVSPFRRSAWWLITGMMVVFTYAKISALQRGLDISCGCTGSDDPMTWMGVAENLVLLVPCVFALVCDHRWPTR